MASAEITGKLVNRGDLARTFGVTPPTVDTWRDKGCPFVGRGGRGKEWTFDTAAVHEWRCNSMVGEAVASYQGGDDSVVSKDEADRRRAHALAIIAEIEADNLVRTTARVADAAAMTSAFCVTLHTGLGSAACRIAGRATTMTSAPEIEQLAKDELNRAFYAAKAAALTLPHDGDHDDTADDA